MKKFSLALGIIGLIVSTASAGSERSGNKQISPAPCQSWYADREWNINLAAAFAFTDNQYPTLENSFGKGALAGELFHHDRYLDSDHGWGAGVDIKYFFSRYFGIGYKPLD